MEENKWMKIDVESLSSELATQQFNSQTKDVHSSELLEITTEKSGLDGKDIKVKTQYRPHYANIWFGLKEGYEKLIKSFAKELEDEDRN